MRAVERSFRSRSERDARRRVAQSAESVVARAVRAGAADYDRERDLLKLTRLDPGELKADTPQASAAIVARLARALRAERNRARSGHWTYDLNRHIALRQAYLAETERLRTFE